MHSVVIMILNSSSIDYGPEHQIWKVIIMFESMIVCLIIIVYKTIPVIS